MNFGCEILSEFSAPQCLSLSTISYFVRDQIGVTLYWVITALMFCAVCFFGFRKEQSKDTAIIGIITGFLILFGRSAYWSLPELNPDEGFAVAAALALQKDPVYWRSAIGCTHGPLLHYVLLIPSWFGLTLDYASSRAMGSLLIVAGTVSTFFSSVMLFGKRAAVVGLLPISLFFAFGTYGDFQAYNGEMMIIAIIGVSILMLCRIAYKKIKFLYISYFLFGFLLGLMPLAKLQGSPIAAVIALFGFYIAWRDLPRKQALLCIAIEAVAGLAPVCLAFLAAIYFDVFDEMMNSTVSFLLYYSSRIGSSFSSKFESFITLIIATIPSTLLLYDTFIYSFYVLIAAALFSPAVFLINRFSTFLVISVVLSSVYSVIKPGNGFHHYLMILSSGVLLFISFSASKINDALEEFPKPVANRLKGFYLITIVFSLFLIIPFWSLAIGSGSLFPSMRGQLPVPWPITMNAVTSLADKKDSMIVWGWADVFYARTGIPPAMKYSNNYLLFEPSPLKKTFTESYIAASSKNMPPVIVQAVGKHFFGFNSRRNYGIKKFPSMQKLIDDHYVLWAKEVDSRVYVRKKRLQRIYQITDKFHGINELIEGELKGEIKPFVKVLRTKVKRISKGIRFRDFDRILEEMLNKKQIHPHKASTIRGKVLLKLRNQISKECLIDFEKC